MKTRPFNPPGSHARGNRRIRRAFIRAAHLIDTASSFASFDLITKAFIKASYYSDTHSARLARRRGVPWLDGVPASYMQSALTPDPYSTVGDYHWLTADRAFYNPGHDLPSFPITSARVYSFLAHGEDPTQEIDPVHMYA